MSDLQTIIQAIHDTRELLLTEVGKANTSIEEVKGDVKEIRASRPNRGEVSTIIETAVQNCAAANHKKNSIMPGPKGDVSGKLVGLVIFVVSALVVVLKSFI